MKKYVIKIAAALSACAFSSCDEETTLPYIPVEKPEDNTPPSGEDPETYTVTYRLDKVLLCSPDNTNGLDISGKLDYFSPLRMTLNVSPLGTTVVFENDEVPFSPFAGLIPEGGGPIACELDSDVTPNVLRIKDSDTVLATFEQDGFTTEFRLDSRLLTYKYKFKSL